MNGHIVRMAKCTWYKRADAREQEALCICTANRKGSFPHPRIEHPAPLPEPYAQIFYEII